MGGGGVVCVCDLCVCVRGGGQGQGGCVTCQCDVCERGQAGRGRQGGGGRGVCVSGGWREVCVCGWGVEEGCPFLCMCEGGGEGAGLKCVCARRGGGAGKTEGEGQKGGREEERERAGGEGGPLFLSGGGEGGGPTFPWARSGSWEHGMAWAPAPGAHCAGFRGPARPGRGGG